MPICCRRPAVQRWRALLLPLQYDHHRMSVTVHHLEHWSMMVLDNWHWSGSKHTTCGFESQWLRTSRAKAARSAGKSEYSSCRKVAGTPGARLGVVGATSDGILTLREAFKRAIPCPLVNLYSHANSRGFSQALATLNTLYRRPNAACSADHKSRSLRRHAVYESRPARSERLMSG